MSRFRMPRWLISFVFVAPFFVLLPSRVAGAIVLEAELYTNQDSAAFGFLYLSVVDSKVEYNLWTSGHFAPPWEIRFEGRGGSDGFALGAGARYDRHHTFPGEPEPWTLNPFLSSSSDSSELWLPVDGGEIGFDPNQLVQPQFISWLEFSGSLENESLAGLLRANEGVTVGLDALYIGEGPGGMYSIRLDAVGRVVAGGGAELAAVPEPAVAGLIFGMAGLGFVLVHRRKGRR